MSLSINKHLMELYSKPTPSKWSILEAKETQPQLPAKPFLLRDPFSGDKCTPEWHEFRVFKKILCFDCLLLATSIVTYRPRHRKGLSAWGCIVVRTIHSKHWMFWQCCVEGIVELQGERSGKAVHTSSSTLLYLQGTICILILIFIGFNHSLSCMVQCLQVTYIQ